MNAASWLEGLPRTEKWRTLLLAHGPRIATWTLAVLLAVQAAVIVTGLGGASRRGLAGANSLSLQLPTRRGRCRHHKRAPLRRRGGDAGSG